MSFETVQPLASERASSENIEEDDTYSRANSVEVAPTTPLGGALVQALVQAEAPSAGTGDGTGRPPDSSAPPVGCDPIEVALRARIADATRLGDWATVAKTAAALAALAGK